MPDNSTLELPQMFSRQAGPIQPVATGPDVSLKAIEGPYQGGWDPIYKDPVMAASALAMVAPGFFSRFVAPFIQSGAIAAGRQGNWQRIPNTTEPDIEGGRPTQFAHSRQNPDWAGRVDVTDPRTVFQGRGTHPELTAPTRYGTGAMNEPSGYPLEYRALRDASARAAGAMGGPARPDLIQQPIRIPIMTSQADYMNPNVRIPSRNVYETMQRLASPEGLTAGGALVPIPEEQPFRITTPDREHVIMSSHGEGAPDYGIPPGRSTVPLSNVFITPQGQAPAPVWTGGRATGDLPTLADLFGSME